MQYLRRPRGVIFQLSGFQYSFPLYAMELAYMTPNLKEVTAFWNLLKPFSNEAWIAITMTYLAVTVLLFLLEALSGKSPRYIWPSLPLLVLKLVVGERRE